MNHNTGLTSGRYVRQWLDLMLQRGAKEDDLFAGTGLAAKQFVNAPPYLSQSQVEQLFHNAHGITGNDHLGIDFGMNLNFAAHGALGFAGLTARSTREASEQMVRYMPIVTGLIGLRDISQRARDIHEVETVALGGLSEFTESTLVETIIGSIYTMSRFLIGSEEPIIVRWQYPACRALNTPFANHNAEIRFNQPVNSIRMRYQATEKRLALADEHARQQSIAMCEQEMQEMIKHTSLRHRIYTQLLSCAQGMPSVEMIADQLHLSARTVHRRLKQEGTCFRDLTNDARMALAKHYFLRDQLTVTEVAYKLGYGDSANFTRAFKRIEGMTPTEFIQHASIGNSSTQ